MKFAIDENLANKIINYLANRPMIKVEDMVNGLRKLQPIEIQEKKEDD